MPAMMIGVVDFDEEFASMEAMLERLSKESAEKDARIKRQEGQIAKLLKKLDKGPRASSNRGASSDEDKKESNRSETSEDDHGSKKGGKPQNDSSLSAMTADCECCQDSAGSWLTKESSLHQTLHEDDRCSSYALWLPASQNSTNLMGGVTQNNMLHTSMKRATMLTLVVIY